MPNQLIRLLAISAMLLAGTSHAKTVKVRDAKLPNGLVVHEYKMSNGMQVLLVPDSSAPVFSYQMWFRVGSVNEKMDPKLQRTGLAHLFEHMMFRGTPKHPDGMFDKKLSAAGAVDMNATTWVDRTNYYQSLPKNSLELTFSLESDRMTNLVINKKLFETELGAVFGELKMGKDKPSRVAYEELWNLAFDSHPYRHTVIGTIDELKTFTVEEAMYFYKTYYAPNNATLILLGDFSIPKALALAEKYYGRIPSQTVPHREPPIEPAQKSAKSKEVSHPLANSDLLMLGYKIPAAMHSDVPALSVAGAMLAYGNGSWLEQELVQTNLASSASAGPSLSKYPSLFVVNVQVAGDTAPDKVIKIVNQGISKLQKNEFTEHELQRAKNQYLLHAYGELTKLNEVGDNLGEALSATGNYLRNFEILEQVKSVTLSDIQRVAKAYLIPESSTYIRMTPAKGK